MRRLRRIPGIVWVVIFASALMGVGGYSAMRISA